MTKVVVDMSMSLDRFVAGPDDGKTFPLGRHGGMHVFDWYTSGPKRPGTWTSCIQSPASTGRSWMQCLYESGALIFGRRTYEITNGWGGRHPVNGAPVFILTHNPPVDYPRGPSNLTFRH